MKDSKMAKLFVLGAGAALPSPEHDTTALALQVKESVTVIETGGSTLQKLQQLDLPLEQVDRLVLTHSHPDHSYGFPAVLLGLWLAGRQQALPVYGPADALDRLRQILTLFGGDEWPNMFPISYRPIPLEEQSLVLETPDLRITASPGKHLIPVVGLRMEVKHVPYTVVFSSDTEPAESIVRLAEGADLLIHESTALEGPLPWHTSAAGAGDVARRAGARRLMLIHLPRMTAEEEVAMQTNAAQTFGGEVILARDNLVLDLA